MSDGIRMGPGDPKEARTTLRPTPGEEAAEGRGGGGGVLIPGDPLGGTGWGWGRQRLVVNGH